MTGLFHELKKLAAACLMRMMLVLIGDKLSLEGLAALMILCEELDKL